MLAGRFKRIPRGLRATFVGLVTFACAMGLHHAELLDTAELKTLDHRIKLFAQKQGASKELVLLALDEKSIEAFGSLPWPRDRYAYLVDFLAKAGAKAVVFDMLFLEKVRCAEEFDKDFAKAMREAGNVFLSIVLLAEDARPDAAVPTGSTVPIAPSALGSEGPPSATALPLEPLRATARSLGFINLFPDRDGTTRRVRLWSAAGAERAWLELSAAAARHVAGVPASEPITRSGGELRMGSLRAPLTRDGDALLRWHGTLDDNVYPTYSVAAVLRSAVDLRRARPPLLDPKRFAGKTVFVGANAAGTYDLRVTPLTPFTPGVLVHMTAFDNLMGGDFLREASDWALPVTLLVLCLSGAWCFMLLRRNALKFTLVAGLGVGYYALCLAVFAGQGLWLELALPELALGLTFGFAASVEYLAEGRLRRRLRAAFDRYVAADVVEEIMRNPDESQLGGRRVETTIFFSDLGGFTTISEQLEPEALVDWLNEYFTVMTEIILRHRGNVQMYLGDGIMACFGAPQHDAEHASRACLASLECQEALVALTASWQARGLPAPATRIGINSAVVVVGNVGSPLRMDYTVIGDGVNLASRLEGANRYYGTKILIGPRTYELARAQVVAREVDVVRVKGRQEPVRLYELMARAGELAQPRRAMLEAYLAGVALYGARSFLAAEERFAAALRLEADDGPSLAYLERTRAHLASPPPPEWDGVHDLTSK